METNESKLRQQLKNLGFGLRKSRVHSSNADNLGGYMIIDISKNSIVRGSKWELSLEDVESFINER